MKCPTKDDWDKLKYFIQYLWKTRFLPLIIGMMEGGVFTIYIDGAHAVHCRGQGELILTFGTGAMLSKSGKLG